MAKGDKPRGRTSAYAYFVQTCREEYKKMHPNENVVFAEFSKKCAERWKTMNEPEKQRFQLMAAKDKKRYEDEMSTYVPKEAPRGKAARKEKDPNAPKRALSAFFHFCQDERPKVRAELGQSTVGEVAKQLGKKWQECTGEQKSKYEQLAAKDKQRYELEMAAYKNGGVAPPAPPKRDENNDEIESE
ncbi:high mobility group protein DSP1-like [Galendromus occidentalis]|uniref:High mobility group protein DSP1-like n=1 Tax=Galendromus occidentalis TaxID=34638 RepID=A0AAJ6QX72_9ACAR|nr:high mobility group protein DSP1-like [Galendromus occidentalis]